MILDFRRDAAFSSRWTRRWEIPVVIPVLFVCTISLSLVFLMGESSGSAASQLHPSKSIEYTTIAGYFLQDEPTTDSSAFDYTKVNLGLMDRSYETDHEFDPHGEKTQWERFERYVGHLNEKSPQNVQYKVLFMGRHGEGYHNVAESYYGTPAWDCYWSMLDGNGTATWADAHLTSKGIAQAQIANAFWRNALQTAGIPAPQSYYTSPLARCLATAKLTFSGLPLPRQQPFVPTIKELLREAIGIHTCDRRSTRTWIHSSFPEYEFERGFAENDPLWTADLRESSSATVARLKELLDDIFTTDSHAWISFTSHSGSIGAILAAIGHRQFSLVTGAVIPALVRAETVHGPSPTSSIAPSTGPPTCTANPTATGAAANLATAT